MTYEFKKYSDLETLEKVPNGATVLGVADGKVVQLPGDGLGGGGFTAVFTMIVDEESGEETMTCDKTFEECLEAYNKRAITGVVVGQEQSSYGMYTVPIYNSASVTFSYAMEDGTVAPYGLSFWFVDLGTIGYGADGTIQMQ